MKFMSIGAVVFEGC